MQVESLSKASRRGKSPEVYKLKADTGESKRIYDQNKLIERSRALTQHREWSTGKVWFEMYALTLRKASK